VIPQRTEFCGTDPVGRGEIVNQVATLCLPEVLVNMHHDLDFLLLLVVHLIGNICHVSPPVFVIHCPRSARRVIMPAVKLLTIPAFTLSMAGHAHA
jgi:hypothetical protein